MLAFFEAAFLFMEEPPSDYKLSLFEDLSRFVGDDSIKHTVKLDLGEGDVILCSGLVLANTSQHLEASLCKLMIIPDYPNFHLRPDSIITFYSV